MNPHNSTMFSVSVWMLISFPLIELIVIFSPNFAVKSKLYFVCCSMLFSSNYRRCIVCKISELIRDVDSKNYCQCSKNHHWYYGKPTKLTRSCFLFWITKRHSHEMFDESCK